MPQLVSCPGDHELVRRDHTRPHPSRHVDSGPALIAAIEEYLRHDNDAARQFIWTKDADIILDKIANCPKALNA